MEYFDNEVIVSLVEKKPIGMISLMDEEVTLSNTDDIALLHKLNDRFKVGHGGMK